MECEVIVRLSVIRKLGIHGENELEREGVSRLGHGSDVAEGVHGSLVLSKERWAISDCAEAGPVLVGEEAEPGRWGMGVTVGTGI